LKRKSWVNVHNSKKLESRNRQEKKQTTQISDRGGKYFQGCGGKKGEKDKNKLNKIGKKEDQRSNEEKSGNQISRRKKKRDDSMKKRTQEEKVGKKGLLRTNNDEHQDRLKKKE